MDRLSNIIIELGYVLTVIKVSLKKSGKEICRIALGLYVAFCVERALLHQNTPSNHAWGEVTNKINDHTNGLKPHYYSILSS